MWTHLKLLFALGVSALVLGCGDSPIQVEIVERARIEQGRQGEQAGFPPCPMTRDHGK